MVVDRLRVFNPRAKFSFLVHDISRMRRTLFDKALRPLGITRAQWWVLGNMSRHSDEGMMQSELARLLETGKVNVGGMIDRLEAAGLVYRQADAHDRRVKRIYITDKGFDMLTKIAFVGNKLDRLLFEGIDEDEMRITGDVMARIKTNIRDAMADSDDPAWLGRDQLIDDGDGDEDDTIEVAAAAK